MIAGAAGTSARATYNRIAGQSAARLAALSDGVFAVAMTLLVLDLRAPAVAAIHSDQELWLALLSLLPRLLMFVMSFMTLGIFWVGQQTQLNHLERSDRSLSWIHIGFLFGVSILPFATTLLAEFPGYRVALVAYWLNMLFLGTMLYVSWVCAVSENLVRSDIPAALSRSIKRRILIAQALYALGALLCIVNTYWSIAVFVVVQLNYALAPHLPRRSRA
jgi:uncharacterized membrane protein